MSEKKQSQGKVPGHEPAPATPRTSRFTVTTVEGLKSGLVFYHQNCERSEIQAF